MRIRPPSFAVVLLSATLLIPSLALARDGIDKASQDWPQVRGVHRDGVSMMVPEAWPATGPPEVWARPIGVGFSGLAVVDGRLFTMTSDAEHEYALALDAATGEELWKLEVGEQFTDEFGDGPRSTPTVAGDVVYMLTSRGRLLALSAADGRATWQLELTEAFGSEVPRWGYSTSPMVEGDLLLLEVGGSEGKAIVALDRQTGETRWTTRDHPASYSSPIAVDLDGHRYVVFAAGRDLVGLDLGGKERWSHPFLSHMYTMPVFLPPDRVFVSAIAPDASGGMVVRVAHGDDGTPQVEELWRNDFFRNHFNSSLYWDGHLFGFDNATLKCISATTGEMAWAKRGFGKGSLIVAGGHLLILSDRGKLVLAKATGEGWQEIASTQALEGKSWTAPTLAGGRLYLRNQSQIKSFDLQIDVNPQADPKG